MKHHIPSAYFLQSLFRPHDAHRSFGRRQVKLFWTSNFYIFIWNYKKKLQQFGSNFHFDKDLIAITVYFRGNGHFVL